MYCIFMFVPNIYSAVVINKFKSAAIQNCTVKIAVLKILEILEDFQENIRDGVQYYLNFGMKACNFSDLELHQGCVLKNFNIFLTTVFQ